MADAAKDRNQFGMTVEARLVIDGEASRVTGRVIGSMASHTKKADGSPTFVSTAVEFDSDDRAKVAEVLLEIAAKHQVRLEARTYDDRSIARAHARRSGEIAEKEA